MDNAEVAETPDVPAKDVEVAEKVLEPEAMGTDGGARILQTAVRQPPGSVTRNLICRVHAQGGVLQIPQISYRCLLLRATYRPWKTGSEPTSKNLPSTNVTGNLGPRPQGYR